MEGTDLPNTSYIAHPSEEDLFIGFDLAVRWSVPRLLSYLQYSLLGKIRSKTIHPIVVLALSRRFGFPWFIKEAVESLARENRPLVEWCLNHTILKRVLTVEVAVIAAMKEQLWAFREKIAAAPKAYHCDSCSANEQAKNHCESAWDAHWFFKVQKYIIGRHSSSSDFNRIREVIRESSVLGMNVSCRGETVTAIIESGIWMMGTGIVEEAIKLLMVDAGVIDGSDGVKEIERVYENEQPT